MQKKNLKVIILEPENVIHRAKPAVVKSVPAESGQDESPSERELRAAKLGQAWAGNSAYKNELNRYAEWRATLREGEWERLFCSGDEQFHDVSEEIIAIMMPDIYAVAPRFVWDRWSNWLQLESEDEVRPEEVRAFLDAAFEVWEQEDMTNL